MPELDENDSLFFKFQNGIFSIRSNEKTIAFPANGEEWEKEYQTTVRNFNRFPKRINRDEIEISVWEQNISIANWRYSLKNSTLE